MFEYPRIDTLSRTSLSQEVDEGVAVVMVGSFAPIHEGHLDAINAASTALDDKGIPVKSLVLTPNSTEYVRKKLPEHCDEWTYERRVQEILSQAPHPRIPTYVDDVSGHLARQEQINDFVPTVIQRYLGFKACQLYLVVGSDQILSMEGHLSDETNKAVCVLRPNNLSEIQERLDTPWIKQAIEHDRLIITERENMERDISSTAIRSSVKVD